MSVILEALKHAGKKKEKVFSSAEAIILKEGEGFFRGRKAMLDPPTTSQKSSWISNKRGLLLLTLLCVVVGLFIFIWQRKPTKVSEYHPVLPLSQAEEEASPNPENGSVLEEAHLAFARGDYDTSSQLLREILEKNPENAQLHNDLGLVLTKKGLYSNAEGHYEKALEIDDKCAECFNNFGYLKSILGQTVEAKKYLEQAIQLSSSYPDPYFNLAVLYEKEGDVGNAVKHYQQFVASTLDKEGELTRKVEQHLSQLTGH